MVTDADIEKALENEFDGQDKFLLVQDILTLRAENEKLKKFEDYSYYVGTEITCGRMPHKYSWWLDSLKSKPCRFL